MVAARYTGLDRENRPFVVTAEVARQKPELDDLITLERPKGDLTTASGNWLELTADTGLYQPQPQLLDLFGNVALFQDKGNEFHSDSAHVDMGAGTAEGDDPVDRPGPVRPRHRRGLPHPRTAATPSSSPATPRSRSSRARRHRIREGLAPCVLAGAGVWRSARRRRARCGARAAGDAG